MEGESKHQPREEQNVEINSEEDLKFFLEKAGIVPEEWAKFKIEKNNLPELQGYSEESKQGIKEVYEPTSNSSLVKTRLRNRELFTAATEQNFIIAKYIDRRNAPKQELPSVRMATSENLLEQDAEITYVYFSLKEIEKNQEVKYIKKLNEKLGENINWQIIHGLPTNLEMRNFETNISIEEFYYETSGGTIQKDRLQSGDIETQMFLPPESKFLAVKEVKYDKKTQEKTEFYKLYVKQ